MNNIVLIAGLLSALGLIWHLTMGRKKFLGAMLAAEFDPLAKNIMLCQYHYVSVMFGLSTLMTIIIGLGLWIGFTAVLYFIAANYLLCAAMQIWLALNSDLPRALIKRNSWIGFIVIAALLILGG